MKPLILASTSRYRRALLERFGLPFSVQAPETDETPLTGETPLALVERLAIAKARAVAAQHDNAVIIGSDQVAVHGSEIAGKPGNRENALAQLQAASGTAVSLMTGVAVIDATTGSLQSTVVTYKVWLRQLSHAEIEHYLDREKPWDCAGSVKLEGLGIALLERLEGSDPTAIIGLPLIETARMLREAGINPLLD